MVSYEFADNPSGPCKGDLGASLMVKSELESRWVSTRYPKKGDPHEYGQSSLKISPSNRFLGHPAYKPTTVNTVLSTFCFVC